MFSLSTIVIAVCDVIIVVCFVLFAFLYRKLARRVIAIRDNVEFCHSSLLNQMLSLKDVRSTVSNYMRELDSLRTNVSDLRSFCDSLITLKEVKPKTTKKTTKKTAKNGKK